MSIGIFGTTRISCEKLETGENFIYLQTVKYHMPGEWVGGLGFIMLFLLLFVVFVIWVSLVKIAVFAFCAAALLDASKKLSGSSPLKNKAVFLFFAIGLFISGYVLLVDLSPAFLNVPAKMYPPLCELHKSPVFTLSILRWQQALSADFSGSDRYAECMFPIEHSGTEPVGLASCNEIDQVNELGLGTNQYMVMECITVAATAGATDCGALNITGQWRQGIYTYPNWAEDYCHGQVYLAALASGNCENIPEWKNYSFDRDECFFETATGMEDCEKISDEYSASRSYRDRCIYKFATTVEDCERIPGGGSIKSECIIEFARVPEDCEKITLENYRDDCFFEIATTAEDCERITGRHDREECLEKIQGWWH